MGCVVRVQCRASVVRCVACVHVYVLFLCNAACIIMTLVGIVRVRVQMCFIQWLVLFRYDFRTLCVKFNALVLDIQ